MAVGTEYTNWAIHVPAPDTDLDYCSPNIAAIYDEMAKRFGCTDIGCYGWRVVRGGDAPSTHGFGGARDIRYPDRTLAVTILLPWLISNSLELHISAIHDYIASSIWHAGRGWKQQTPSKVTGMGQSWANYFHIETTLSGWHDGTPVPNRLVPLPVPKPTPTPGGDAMQVRLLVLTDSDAQFLAQTDDEGQALFVTWAGPGSPEVDRAVAAHRAEAARKGHVFEQPGDLAGLYNCVRIGELPHGDTQHDWTGAEFWRSVTG